MLRCTLCPRFASAPTCIRCSERVDSARTAILRRLVLPYAAQLQAFAESDMGIPISPAQTSAPNRSADTLPPKPAKTGEVATGGKDGIKAASLLSVAKDQGADVLRRITQTAVTRMLASGRAQAGLYTAAERQALAETLAGVTASADLLGRSRIQERKTTIETRRVKRFSERSTGFIAFADPIAPMAPERAVDYFRGLVPTLGTDPQRFGADQRRRAFTLAVATERTLLAKVQSIIQQGLESGESTTGLARKTQEILDAAGVSSRNPYYSTMVVRTNMMDAYNEGQTAEMQAMDDFFPVWRYDGIRDGREGDDHRPHFGKYYPASASFASVRGKRIYSCRCTMTPIDQYEWEDLVAKGARVESGYGAVEKPKAVKQSKGKAAPQASPARKPLAELTPVDVQQMSRKELLATAEEYGLQPGKRTTETLRQRIATDIEMGIAKPATATPEPTPTVAPTPPTVPTTVARPKPAKDPKATVAKMIPMLARENTATIADLQEATGLDYPTLHQAINDLRREGVIAGSSIEGRGGVDQRTLESLIDPKGESIGSVQIRRPEELARIASGKPAEPAPAAAPEQPKINLAAMPPAKQSATIQAIANATTTGGFGTNKVMISHVYDNLKAADPTLTRERFDAMLLEAIQRGELEMSRADLPFLLNPADVAASTLKHPNGEFQFLVTPNNFDRAPSINPERKRR